MKKSKASIHYYCKNIAKLYWWQKEALMYNIVCKGPGKAALPHENEYNLLSNMILTTGIIVLQERKTLATVDHT